MPCWFYSRSTRTFCQKKPTWSMLRGGCRKEPNHKDKCAPGRYR